MSNQLLRPYATEWHTASHPALVAFREWAERAPALLQVAGKSRAAVIHEGVMRASARRVVMRDLIAADPRAAIAAAVPAALRPLLPGAVQALLEERVEGTGDILVSSEGERTGASPTSPVLARVGGRYLRVSSYGRGVSASRLGVGIHGIALDGRLALHEHPARILEPGEFSSPTRNALVLVRGAVAASTASGPFRFDPAHTTGDKRFLLVRARYADVDGPISDTTSAEFVHNILPTRFRDLSYGKLRLTGDFTPEYQLPRARAYYNDLRWEVVAAAAHDAASQGGFQPGTYDFLLISVPNGGFNPVAWIGDTTSFYPGGPGSAPHEVGHSLGLRHTARWHTTTGSAIGPGFADDYGDHFDLMGHGGGDYNPYYKYQLHWLDDADVSTIVGDGEYRVYRFDHPASSGVRALKIRRGDGRAYWVGMRQKETGTSLDNGAYIVRGSEVSDAASELLDFTPDTDNHVDAGLQIGDTFSDAELGLSLTVLRKGGTSPAEYFDVAVSLSVLPRIVGQPASATVISGFAVSFHVEALSARDLTFQWRLDGFDLPGETGSTCDLPVVAQAHAGRYNVAVTAGTDSVESAPATLTVLDLPPTLRTLPQPQHVAEGGTVTLTVVADGSVPLRYQWYRDNQSIDGATDARYTIADAALTQTAQYWVVVTNDFGFAESPHVAIDVDHLPPAIDGEWRRRTTLRAGAAFSAWVRARGAAPLTYQWRHNGAPLTNAGRITGAASPALAITAVTTADAGTYDVVVTDGLGATTRSALRFLQVVPACQIATWGADSGAVVPPALLDAVQVSAAGSFLLVRTAGGRVVASGASGTGSAAYLAALPPIIDVAASSSRNIALAADGRLFAWNDYAREEYPPSEVVGFDSCPTHYLLLHGDGTVSAWGAGGDYGHRTPPSTLGFVVEVAAAMRQSYALQRDGSVVRFGEDDSLMRVPAGLSDVTMLAAGDNHVLALRANGSVVAWGSNTAGQSTVPAGLANVVAIAAGRWHSLALCANGRLVVWGDTGATTPGVPSWLTGIQGVAGGDHFCAALTAGALPPRITVPPMARQLVVGQRLELSVVAAGTALRYQWTGPHGSISGATSDLLVIPHVATTDAGMYWVRVTNDVDFVDSPAVFVSVLPAPPAIVQPLQPVTATAGTRVVLSVVVVGSAPFTFAWTRNGFPLSETVSSLVIQSVGASHVGAYRVAVRNFAGQASSGPVPLNVRFPVFLTQQLVSVQVERGQSATFSVEAEGTGPITYQWRHDTTPVGSTSDHRLTIPAATDADAGTYSVTVSNTIPSSVLSTATLTVVPPTLPRITVQPHDANARVGHGIGLSVVAESVSAMTYQWLRNDVEIPGATSQSYLIRVAQLASAGFYTVVIRNAAGPVTSRRARVLVAP